MKYYFIKKTTFLYLFFFSCFNILAQDESLLNKKVPIREFSFGIAVPYDLSGNPTVFPGLSYLWGRTHITKSNFIFEYAAGLALPTIATCKLGIGLKMNETQLTIGIRPFPSNLYLQSTFSKKEKGCLLISLEYNPFSPNSGLSFESNGLLNFGYRYDLEYLRNKRKEKERKKKERKKKERKSSFDSWF
jgi:hypothetical protein